MGKVQQVANGEVGSSARTKWNQAMKEVEITGDSLSGDGTTGNPIQVNLLNEDDLASDSTTQAATQSSVKAYVDNQIGSIPAVKSYSIGKVASGTHWLAGHYEFSAADANLTQASTTLNFGTANNSYASRPFAVAGGSGSTDGSDLVLTISGTSITDAGVRTAGDSEVLIADCTTQSTDQYNQPSKKWIGQVIFTLSSTGATTFSFDFNYGFVKFEDFGNRDFTVTDFEVVGDCNATDTGVNFSLILHDGTGWTYSAAAFAGYPVNNIICDMNTDHVTEKNIYAGQYFAYKRSSLATPVNGDGPDGVVIKLDQAANNSIDHADFHIGIEFSATEIT